ncbi:MAG: tol-pal system protein YbgF [Proteobacteria bacterium]|nr:tol-pal system protein YbgF [Pseudomonadota bacterium]MDE3207580.1 tol-pal system protein YbgF [Pseudomonadota bacterium]
MGTKPSHRSRLPVQVIVQGILLAGLLGVAPASQAGLFTDNAARRQIHDLKDQVASLTTLVNQLQGQIRQESLDTLNQLNGIKSQLSSLQNEADQNSHDIQQLGSQVSRLQLKLKKMASSAATGQPAAASGPNASPAGGSLPVTSTATTTVGHNPLAAGTMAPGAGTAGSGPVSAATLSDIDAYNAAFNLLKLGHFNQAIVAMKHFLVTYPDSTYDSNAQYWIGNCQYALGQYRKAAASERLMLATYPNSAKVPDAMLNLADDLVEMGHTADAKKVYKDLVKRFPRTAASDQAKAQLRTMN